MNCARCKGILLDAALGALPPAAAAELHAHLEACASCHAEFEAQRLLVAAMDRGVAATVAPEPTPAFSARVHARLSQREHTQQRAGWLGWATLTAGWALVVVAVFALWLNVGGPALSGNGPMGPLWIGFSLPEVGAMPAVPSIPESPFEVVRVASNTPSVLVPPDQWSGILRFYSAIRSDRVDAASLLAAPPVSADVAIQPLEMPELKIAPLEVAKPESESKSPEPPPVPKRSNETGR